MTLSGFPIKLVLLTIVWVCVFTDPAPADEKDKKYRPSNDYSVFNFQLENDLFRNKDNQYTNGVRLSYTHKAKTRGSRENNSSSPNVRAGNDPGGAQDEEWDIEETMDGLSKDVASKRWGVSLNQTMFTPDNIFSSKLEDIINDRPYAGWLFLGLSFYNEIGDKPEESSVIAAALRNLTRLNVDELRVAELDIGVIGPASFSDEAQNWIHDVRNIPNTKGWHFQLENQPGFALFYERKWRIYADTEQTYGFDVTPNAGFAIGNAYDFLNAGATLRFGFNIHKDYGPPRIRPALNGSEFFKPDLNLSWYVFAGYEGRYVAHNAFLTGDETNIKMKRLVGDFQYGAVLSIWQLRVGYTNVIRTKEFDSQKGAQEFGSVFLSVAF